MTMAPNRETFMQQAFEQARRGMHAGDGGPFGAIIVRHGEIVGRGNNRVISSNDPTAHAEIEAIRDACRHLAHFQLADCELFTTCEPCPMCLGAIYWARPTRVWYGSTRHDAALIGFDDELIYDEINIPADRRIIPMERILEDEADRLFREWMDLPGKVLY